MKKIRIYELYQKGNGKISCYTCYHGEANKQIWHVAAVSIEQAYFFASKRIWRDSGRETGIVSYTPDSSECEWQHDDGTSSWEPKNKHYHIAKKQVQTVTENSPQKKRQLFAHNLRTELKSGWFAQPDPENLDEWIVGKYSDGVDRWVQAGFADQSTALEFARKEAQSEAATT